MAKKFNKSKMSGKFDEVGKISEEKANVFNTKNIANENLIDYPKNQEDIKETLDIENSIKEMGFTDPIEVTDFGQPNGKFMIVSGHRRRAAGVKCGIEFFPCVVKQFNSEEEVNNYVLLANSHRDTSKDPLLFVRRYKQHEDYLKSIDFKGSIKNEIAKRLGISAAQAERLSAMDRVILPILEMVSNEIVGISSVYPIAQHTPEEQKEILSILNECLEMGGSLTRETVKSIVEGYRVGKRSYNEITKSEKFDRFDKFDKADDNEDGGNNDNIVIENDEDNAIKTGQDIIKCLAKLNTYFMNTYSFGGEIKNTELAFNSMATVFEMLIDELHGISKDHNLKSRFDRLLLKMAEKINDKVSEN
jgi:ParB family chromosome partitioning protein